MAESLDLIRMQGDSLEQEMFQDQGFADLFPQYPLVWRQCVFRKRAI
jgi:hypothetical protein